MSQFLEIYSSHRDRTSYPLVSNFVVPFQPALTNRTDPIVNGAVFYTWSGTETMETGTLRPGSSNATPLLSNKDGHQPSVVNAYVGYGFVTGGQSSLIIGYQPSSCSLTLQQALSSVQAGRSYAITDPSTASSIHIPYHDQYGNAIRDYAQAYTNYYLIDETLSDGTTIVAQPIIAYNSTKRIATLAAPLPGWSISDSYTIRQSLPQEKWTITVESFYNQDGTVGPLGAVITLPAGASSTDNYYNGRYLYFYSNSPPPTLNQFIFQPIYGAFYVKSYNGATRQAFVEDDPNAAPLPYFRIQTGTFLAGSTVIAPILSNGSRQDRSYLNYLLTNSSGETRTIIAYTGLTQTATVNSAFSTVQGDYTLTTPQGINVASLTRDNVAGLDYIGTLTSVSTSVCYEIGLVDLILPNVPLVTGSRAAYSPFLYVKLENVSASEKASTDLIYSNNPPSKNALFIAPVFDIVSPGASQFVKLRSYISQTIKFKPTDSFHFSVTLPDGSYFQPVQPDLTTPYAPNSQLQIHATFSLRRI